MEQVVEKKKLMELTGDDARFIERARAFGKDLHREVYRCLCIICELDIAGDFLFEDARKMLVELRAGWANEHAEDLAPEKPKTLEEHRAGVAEGLVEKIEGLLNQFLPDCQSEVIDKLAANLPKRLAEDELEELMDSAACAVGDGIINSGLPLRTQIALFKQLKTAAEKAARGLNGAKKRNAR